MNELTQVDLLNNDSALFNIEFNNLKKFYTLNNEKEIWDFIKIHPGVIVLLNAYEQSLKKYFTGAVFELKFNPDLSGSWFDLIALTVWVDEETFNNGSIEHIYSIDHDLLPLRRRLNLLGAILLTKRILK